MILAHGLHLQYIATVSDALGDEEKLFKNSLAVI